ncbi:MAG: hypothetical protein DRJ07_02670 [Bacteroidetes bacterium]|nr:MAG: hypothetical protein DRI73_06820 [Bacteroidota bacterium]RLD85607.1 MAG: hypothetical protein DRJ07_02670 [Bacteroidota bacterium]
MTGKFHMILAILLLFIIHESCQNDKKDEIKILENKLHLICKNSKNKKLYFIIIPQSGCPGCIERSLKFVRNNISNDSSYYVVLTNITDKKYFSHIVGTKVLGSKNIQFDHNNEIGILSHTSFYPKIVLIRNGKIKSIVEANPENKNIWDKISVNQKSIFQ